MLVIENKEIFSKTVEQSLRTAQSVGSTVLTERWTVAIVKAAAFINSADLTFVEYDRKTGQLVVLSESNRSYVTGDKCECTAFTEFSQPCYHRAMARLIKRYYENLERPEPTPMAVFPVEVKDRPRIIACEDTSCGWQGMEHELLSTLRTPACPKCESRDLFETEAVAVMTVGGLK